MQILAIILIFALSGCAKLSVKSLTLKERLIKKTPRTSLAGIVTDSIRQPIRGAQIKIGAASVTSDAYGRFRIENVAAGSVSIIISSAGYRTANENLKLKPGAQSISVSLAKLDPVEPTISSSEPRIAYITIDDGPDPKYTPQVLDILARYNVKATFFLIGKKLQKYPEIAVRERENGDAIGNHSYDHDYKVLYKSGLASFLADIQKNESIIESVLHFRPSIMRPPGGAAGNFSAGYGPALKAAGYRVVLWSVSTGDGSSKTTADGMVQNTISEVSTPSFQKRPIILMHDTHQQTIIALPKIIEYLKGQGYKFDIVTNVQPQPPAK